IEGFNRGTGNVTITAEAISNITASTGIGIGAFAQDGGNVTVTNDSGAVDTGATGLNANADKAGTISITNHGSISGTVVDGIDTTQTATVGAVNGVGGVVATGSTTITNDGSITGNANAISIQENASGTATIDNLSGGTIGSTAGGHAILESGGTVS